MCAVAKAGSLRFRVGHLSSLQSLNDWVHDL